ncbi:MAG: response regulator [Caulobacteraceae bacterium]
MNRILVINDSRFESMILNDTLSQMGYNVKITDEYDAMNQVQSFSPDVVLVNYIMRDTSGDQMADRIKSGSSKVRCILTSSNNIDRKSLSSNKVDAIIKTPVNKSELETVLRGFAGANHEENTENNRLKSSLKEWKDRAAADAAFKFCPSCGKTLDSSADKKYRFCPYCGQSL